MDALSVVLLADLPSSVMHTLLDESKTALGLILIKDTGEFHIHESHEI